MKLRKFSKNNFDEAISFAKDNLLTDEDIIFLAKTMATSGDTLSNSSRPHADIPSTGGPSSLSTLIIPYLLIDFGMLVPKLGVKGRPAGGIDVMAQIRNYKINYSTNEIRDVIDKCGYCHFIADSKFAPLDAEFFKYRSENNAKAIPELVIASILSKKIAVGVTNLGIDIRYFKGANFGNTLEEATSNASRFITIAEKCGINCNAFLSDLSNPIQPYIGRGEALVALSKILNNEMDSWLKIHFDDCLKMSLIVSSKKEFDLLDFDSLKSNFINNLEAQGSNYECFEEKVNQIEKANRIPIYSKTTGFLDVNLNLIRDVFVGYQNTDDVNLFPDNIGIILLKRGGEFVNKNECIATLRIYNNNTQQKQELIIKEIEKAFIIKNVQYILNPTNILKL